MTATGLARGERQFLGGMPTQKISKIEIPCCTWNLILILLFLYVHKISLEVQQETSNMVASEKSQVTWGQDRRDTLFTEYPFVSFSILLHVFYGLFKQGLTEKRIVLIRNYKTFWNICEELAISTQKN